VQSALGHSGYVIWRWRLVCGCSSSSSHAPANYLRSAVSILVGAPLALSALFNVFGSYIFAGSAGLSTAVLGGIYIARSGDHPYFMLPATPARRWSSRVMGSLCSVVRW